MTNLRDALKRLLAHNEKNGSTVGVALLDAMLADAVSNNHHLNDCGTPAILQAPFRLLKDSK